MSLLEVFRAVFVYAFLGIVCLMLLAIAVGGVAEMWGRGERKVER